MISKLKKHKIEKYFNEENIISTIPLLISIILVSYVILKTAWLSDDAYITLRTVDNFINGYGLTYNIIERVQSYTHPLWMGLLIIANLITGEAYLSTILLSVAISILAIIIFYFKISSKSYLGLIGVLILIFSKAYIDYSTSGLENPLSNLITVIFFVLYLSKKEKERRDVFWLLLTASFGILNRLDLILIFLPPIIHILITKKLYKPDNIKKSFLSLFLGISPVIIWFMFSVFYYGFLFPNTAYAKLNTGISNWLLIQQGYKYFQNSLLSDSITLIIILTGIITGLSSKKPHYLSIVTSILLYLGYILYIGGDFMSGRFFTVPLLIAVIIISSSEIFHKPINIYLLCISVLILGLSVESPPIFSNKFYGTNRNNLIDLNGIADERRFYFPYTGLFRDRTGFSAPTYKWAIEGKQLRAEGVEFYIKGTTGFLGYYAGPNTYILDFHALNDALLARLPVRDSENWRIGHFARKIPAGYIDTIQSKQNRLEDENISQYYEKLNLIIKGDLFDFERLLTIWDMNLGKFEYLLP